MNEFLKEITGTEINFYFHCQRQLWFFGHNINTEHVSEQVYIGRLIHESSYQREKKEIELAGVKIDFLDMQNGVLHEIKKSDSWHEAHEWQLLYYLYLLKKRGVDGLIGKLNYPVIKRTIRVELTEEKEKQLEKIIAEINRIMSLPSPLPISVKKSVCRQCSYFELCYV